jgi:RNA-directed DNA polymerase
MLAEKATEVNGHSGLPSILKLGTSFNAAIPVALGRKGPWRIARIPATQSGMTNRWLHEQGLPVVKELWVNIHYPATARYL